jgi:hypothetical protein
VADGGGHPGLLGAVDQVVEQHPQPAAGPRAEHVDGRRQVVHAVESLDDHALDPQVVAPHLLDQLGIVDTLDQDAAGLGHPGPVRGDRRRARGRAGRAAGELGPGGRGGQERDVPAVDPEPAGVEPHQPPGAGVAVADGHAAVLEAEDRPLDTGGPVQHLEPDVTLDLGVGRAPPPGRIDVQRTGENAVAGHEAPS